MKKSSEGQYVTGALTLQQKFYIRLHSGLSAMCPPELLRPFWTMFGLLQGVSEVPDVAVCREHFFSWRPNQAVERGTCQTGSLTQEQQNETSQLSKTNILCRHKIVFYCKTNKQTKKHCLYDGRSTKVKEK